MSFVRNDKSQLFNSARYSGSIASSDVTLPPVMSSIDRSMIEGKRKRRSERKRGREAVRLGLYPLSLLKNILLEDEIIV